MATWRVLGASVEGVVHADKERGCEDAHGWSTDEHATVLVVADGAGSRPGTSALGSHVAVATVLEAAREQAQADAFANDPPARTAALVERVVQALSAEARARELQLGSLATTLCVALLSDDLATVAQIGDGVAVVERIDGRIEAVAQPDHFEYANEVVFITAEDALEHLKVFTATEVRSVALSTDGLRYKILDDVRADRPFMPFFKDSWAYARSEDASSSHIEAFLRDVDDQTGDDKTLVLAVHGYAGESGEAFRLTDRPSLPAAAMPEADTQATEADETPA